jgi:hypothetical protein
VKTDAEKRYEDALQQLSDLVEQRDQALLQLDTMASLPLSISPRSGNVAEFDLDTAQMLLDRVHTQTERIRTAMEMLNRYAEQCSRPEVRWLKMPASRKRGFAAADE